MRKKFLTSKGLTLVELLLALSLIGLVSVLIVGVLVSGMNSYRSVNKQISLHDEANAIMTKFSKEIFIATEVLTEPEVLENPEDPVEIINIKQYGSDAETIKLEFTTKAAKIDGTQINSSMVDVLDASHFTVHKDKGTVHIHLEIQEKNGNGKTFQLTEEVSYVQVE